MSAKNARSLSHSVAFAGASSHFYTLRHHRPQKQLQLALHPCSHLSPPYTLRFAFPPPSTFGFIWFSPSHIFIVEINSGAKMGLFVSCTYFTSRLSDHFHLPPVYCEMDERIYVEYTRFLDFETENRFYPALRHTLPLLERRIHGQNPR